MNIHLKHFLISVILTGVIMITSAHALDSLPMPGRRDNKFYTDVNPLTMGTGETLSTSVKFLFEKNNRTPKARLPVQQVDPSPFSSREKGEFNSTWLGHSSLMINMDGFRILLDPVFEQKISTVKAHQDLGGNILHPIHWGTFNLSLHPWYDPMTRLKAAAEAAGITIATPMAGQTIDFNTLGSPWWEAPMHETLSTK